MKHLLFILLCFSLVISACNDTTSNSANETVSDNFIPANLHSSSVDSVKVLSLHELKGSELYVKNCKFCHGNAGEGDGVKARLSDGEICPFDLTQEKNPDEFLYYVILNGKDKMPGQKKLSEEEIKVLIMFIKSFSA